METNSRMVRQFTKHPIDSHLCRRFSSGDTGVAASLVLHGTPPFHVYYRMQRDKEPARELVKTFYNSRGEMTVQPSQSGHYIYSFSHLSDANYNKVELKGPTVDQIVHPLASAVFAGSSGRDRLTINSCSENSVDVDVNLMVCIDRRVIPT
jgi:nucleoporin POM152